MGNIVTNKDFHWVHSDEPHATRRKLILGININKIFMLAHFDLLFFSF